MTPAFEQLVDVLKKLPGLGYRSAERMALHLLVESPEAMPPLQDALAAAAKNVGRCVQCGNLCEAELCGICEDTSRDASLICVVERVPDLIALERASVHRGRYAVLHGRLSPINGIGPEQLNFAPLQERIAAGDVQELILALSSDIEGQATAHYIQQELLQGQPAITLTRLGYGLPSAGEITFADSATLQNAFASRRPV